MARIRRELRDITRSDVKPIRPSVTYESGVNEVRAIGLKGVWMGLDRQNALEAGSMQPERQATTTGE